ncbi:hypothetical protein [Citricoccus alkalitolerans]|uniref:Uncharacterized protein n=1 Tax=Citricoccus alkalitolerans TaxID=246603 RepID=A0ABV8Y1I4_9MICC
MRMSRLPGAAAVSGLVLITASVPLYAGGLDRWAPALLATGLLGVAAYLVTGLRSTQRDLRTLAGNLERSRRQQLAADRPRPGSPGQDVSGQELAASLDGMRDDIRTLAEDVAALRDRAALRAWQVLGDRRREGMVCLVVDGHDASSILAADRTGAAFEVLDPVTGGIDGERSAEEPTSTTGLPATPAHAVGALLIDLDRFAIGQTDRGREAWSSFARWLRSDVPVLGFSRVPERLSLGAAGVARATGGVLLPVVEAPTTVRFDRGIEPGSHHGTDPATEPSTARTTEGRA